MSSENIAIIVFRKVCYLITLVLALKGIQDLLSPGLTMMQVISSSVFVSVAYGISGGETLFHRGIPWK